MGLKITGRSLLGGSASAELMVTGSPLSFWGGYDQTTGEIIDRRHELSGRVCAGKLLAFPYTIGSSTTTAILLESVRAGVAPAGFIMSQVDHFIALASVVAEEMYGVTLPIVVVEKRDFETLRDGMTASVSDEGEIELSP